MSPEPALILAALILVAAFLYASVGHAGASGHLAAMALFAVPPAVTRPTALVLNILVAGVGGGIFLTPLLIFMRWATVKVTSGVAAAFILVNSVAGLAGQMTRTVELPAWIPLWAAVAVLGGYFGAAYGSRRLQATGIQRLLGLVLVIAGVTMLANV
jgi:uncharacterized membrane protein YfcA